MEFRLFRPVLRRFIPVVCLAAWLGAGAAADQAAAATGPAVQAAPVAPAEVRILARNQERTGDRIFASGDVEVRHGEFLLFADRVEYDLATKDGLAEGNVVAQSGGEVIRADRIRFNLESGRGTIENASGLIRPTILFEAERLERTQDGHLLPEQGAGSRPAPSPIPAGASVSPGPTS